MDEKNNLPSPEQRSFQTDFSLEDQKALMDFRGQGLPGAAKIQDTDIFKWFNLYMKGRSYAEIAKLDNKPLEHILYHADRQRWCEKKTEHLDNLVKSLSSKMTSAKIEGLAFLHDLLSFTHQLYSQDIIEFLTTKNQEAAARVDLKIVDKYVKIVDAINKLHSSPDDWMKAAQDLQRPSVNINIGNAEIKRSENTIDIQASEGKSILAILAEEKKRRESQNK